MHPARTAWYCSAAAASTVSSITKSRARPVQGRDLCAVPRTPADDAVPRASPQAKSCRTAPPAHEAIADRGTRTGLRIGFAWRIDARCGTRRNLGTIVERRNRRISPGVDVVDLMGAHVCTLSMLTTASRLPRRPQAGVRHQPPPPSPPAPAPAHRPRRPARRRREMVTGATAGAMTAACVLARRLTATLA